MVCVRGGVPFLVYRSFARKTENLFLRVADTCIENIKSGIHGFDYICPGYIIS